MGWSDEWETGHDATAIAHNLKALLAAAGEEGPYVLIGHSLGGSPGPGVHGHLPG